MWAERSGQKKRLGGDLLAVGGSKESWKRHPSVSPNIPGLTSTRVCTCVHARTCIQLASPTSRSSPDTALGSILHPTSHPQDLLCSCSSAQRRPDVCSGQDPGAGVLGAELCAHPGRMNFLYLLGSSRASFPHPHSATPKIHPLTHEQLRSAHVHTRTPIRIYTHTPRPVETHMHGQLATSSIAHSQTQKCSQDACV